RGQLRCPSRMNSPPQGNGAAEGIGAGLGCVLPVGAISIAKQAAGLPFELAGGNCVALRE
ncbi:hypothetical protein, partial [Pseudomonas sp. BN417]|uniref:hypothetical protein n=1 Tax=Pseudomonas sp. BN417 TaxID=2567890 RepID=UPI002458647F